VVRGEALGVERDGATPRKGSQDAFLPIQPVLLQGAAAHSMSSWRRRSATAACDELSVARVLPDPIELANGCLMGTFDGPDAISFGPPAESLHNERPAAFSWSLRLVAGAAVTSTSPARRGGSGARASVQIFKP
jgi:hypothetical protein